MKSIVGIMAALALGAAAAVAQSVDEQIAERLAAPDSICMQGDECAAAAPAATAAAGGGPRSGEEVYNGACGTCHAAGVAGAPKFADAAAWSPRIAKGMETLYSNAINGINAMPAKGLCADCSDEEIQAAVDYMVESAQ
ncbi:cytochrome c5 family protein [Microbulbifer flavimaris]|uniref:Cytochrome c5 family protein n=1 Tax=Microbulbifer flavimaris TaxID=1781068 RepID=A0ABX4HYB6_9GAMM|nr:MULTISPECIES: c-type cytochrome [Microbulbifer]KUJ82944.1 cytochrome C [Microbulbifer sp. ZGT114]PCO05129.1 cytochrome c5 family protein [Microbulbifer flavimaris]